MLRLDLMLPVKMMNRKPTRQSRGPNAAEKKHMAWVNERSICAACNASGPVILHHCEGSTFKSRVGLERVLLGHWFVLGLCQNCDDIVTRRSRRAFREKFGDQSDLWLIQAESYPHEIPLSVIQGISNCGR